MKRCKSCRNRSAIVSDICPVCGIDPDKDRKDLTNYEKHVRRRARNIRLVAMLHLILAGVLIMRLPESDHHLGMASIAIISIILGIGLMRYDFRAYKLAVTCYFGYGMVSVISIQHGAGPIAGILIALTAIYVVGNKTAKAIFERRPPELNQQ